MFRRLPALVTLLALAGGCSHPDAAHRSDTSATPGLASAAPLRASAVPRAKKPEGPVPKRPYNVVLIMIDALRADMPWNGYKRQIAPWLTRFEKQCTDYTHAYSLSSYTAKSVAPALVGDYPSAMKHDGYFFTHWFDDNLFIGERLQKAGMRTLAGQGHGYFLPAFGLNQGFDDYRLLPGTHLDLTGVHNITSPDLDKLAKTMLSDPENVDQKNGKRFFAYFHFLDPHFVYIKHPGDPDYGNKRRNLYDNEVHFTDRWVGNLIDWAKKKPWGEHTVFIITADHGEGFGVHNQYRHAYELWEMLVRVPWFICVPGAPGHRVATPRSAIDLAPTIADLMGVKADPPFRGKSLVSEVFGKPEPPRPVITELPRCNLMDRRRALIWKGYKLLAFGDDTRYLLYNVDKDPTEQHDLVKKEPAKFEEMKKLYEKISATIPKVPVVGGAPLKGAPPGQRW